MTEAEWYHDDITLPYYRDKNPVSDLLARFENDFSKIPESLRPWFRQVVQRTIEAALDDFQHRYATLFCATEIDERCYESVALIMQAIEDVGLESMLLLSLVEPYSGALPWYEVSHRFNEQLTGRQLVRLLIDYLGSDTINRQFGDEEPGRYESGSGTFDWDLCYRGFLVDRWVPRVIARLLQRGATAEDLISLLDAPYTEVRERALGFLCWMRPNLATLRERIKVSTILGEHNVEFRRALVGAYGFANFMRDAGASIIHQDEFGELYCFRFKDYEPLNGIDEPLVMVKVTNKTPEPDGSHREYCIRVPPRMNTAREAVAWTFQMSENEYDPRQET